MPDGPLWRGPVVVKARPVRPVLLVAASDVGTANFLAPVLPALTVSWRAFAHPEAARVFAEHEIACTVFERTGWDGLAALGRAVLEQARYSAVLAGTSWGPTLDKAVTLAAREKGLPSVAIVEHWSLYRERFSRVAGGRIIDADAFLPDRIWVNDEIALREACDAGLPRARLCAVGQPHLEACGRRLAKYRNVERDGRTVFVSERLRDDFVADSPLDLGFDEYAALEGLMSALPRGAKLVIKLHPQEPADKYDGLCSGRADIEVVGRVPVDDLIGRSGRIVGMLSMLLLEAALIRDDVVSFMPDGRPADFVGNRIGATQCVTSAAELAHSLKSPSSSAKTADFAERFSGSAERVAASIGELACA
jgi:hypothetical protein